MRCLNYFATSEPATATTGEVLMAESVSGVARLCFWVQPVTLLPALQAPALESRLPTHAVGVFPDIA
jgi:hypothetical protein